MLFLIPLLQEMHAPLTLEVPATTCTNGNSSQLKLVVILKMADKPRDGDARLRYPSTSSPHCSLLRALKITEQAGMCPLCERCRSVVWKWGYVDFFVKRVTTTYPRERKRCHLPA